MARLATYRQFRHLGDDVEDMTWIEYLSSAGGALSTRTQPDDPQLVKQQLNRYSNVVGFSPVSLEGPITTSDANLVIRVHQWIWDTFVCDAADRSARMKMLNQQLSDVSAAASAAGISPQVALVAAHDLAIINTLKETADAIEAKTLARCAPRISPLLIGAAAVVGWLIFGKDK